MSLGDLSRDSGRSLAGRIISAYLTWPSDASKRNDFLAAAASEDRETLRHDGEWVSTVATPMLDELEAQGHSIEAQALREQLRIDREDADARLEAHGGPHVLARAESLEQMRRAAAKRMRDWFTAGTLLDIICRLATHPEYGEPAVNKAVHLLEWVATVDIARAHLHRNPKSIRAAWSSHRHVAHVAAALGSMLREDLESAYRAGRTAIPDPNPLGSERVLELLGRAAACQRFILTYVQPRAKAALAAPNTMHLLPEAGPWPSLVWEPGPLSEEAVVVLKDYRAPKRL